MSQPELLRKVVQTLDAVGIDYMVTGSVVSSLQGEPRASHDIDIVISIEKAAIPGLLKSFPTPDYYLDQEDIHEALRSKTMFNLLDIKGGDKVDFWLLSEEPFDRARFSRKYEEDVMGMKVKMSRPEDSILMKLRWAKLSGGSEKQFTDALRVYEVQFRNLDLSYLDTWAKTLKVTSLWARLKKEAQVME